jgi:Nitroreductase
MNTIEAISARRSIRKFQDKPIPDEKLKAVLEAGILAPSGKNCQPWRFVVVREDKRDEMLKVMRAGIEAAKAHGVNPGSSEWTAKTMERAPITIFVFNPYCAGPEKPEDVGRRGESDVVAIQSIGAAIQNMLLAAEELGLGSLWICDVFYAYHGLCAWLGEKGELIAAVSLGYPAEAPEARPRKRFDEVVRFA